MDLEIERKFLVRNGNWRNLTTGISYRQGYLSTDVSHQIRIRTVKEKGYLTIKSIHAGMTRTEYEYEIPVNDPNELLSGLCDQQIIDKMRYKIPFAGLDWEVDEFFGENRGLIIAEIELNSEDQKISAPDWIGKEVTGEARYYNANLAFTPFTTWPDK